MIVESETVSIMTGIIFYGCSDLFFGSFISTTNLAACVCVSSKFDQFLPLRFYFVSKRPENFVRIAKFPYAAFGPLFAFHCPLFVTKNNNLGWNRHRRFATHRNMQVQRSRSARGQ